MDRALRALFKEAKVSGAHAHRFRHTLATELSGLGASFEDVADILGNSPEIVRKHHGKMVVGATIAHRSHEPGVYGAPKAPRPKARVQSIR